MPGFSWAPLLSSLLILTPFREVPYLLINFPFFFYNSSFLHIILTFSRVHIKKGDLFLKKNYNPQYFHFI